MRARAVGCLFLFALAACSSAADPGSTSSRDAGAPSPPGEDAGAGEGGAAPADRTSGCGAPVSGAGSVRKVEITSGGKARVFHLSIPRSYDPGVPHRLLFVLHGATDTDPAQMKDWFAVEAALGGATIAVYPQALPRTHADGSGGLVTRWDVDGAEDLAFFDAMLEAIGRAHCLATGQVFVTGFSSGGNFAQQLACKRRAALRAAAPVAGPGPFSSKCDGALPIWITHDQDDEALPVGGARSSRDFWARQNGCKGAWVAATPSACQRNDGCPASSPLVYCESKGVGHDVPPYAVDAIARFFAAL
ncbi:MAG: hypothetical protein JNL38_28600 [Myxococcales bacterium]|nr:hypothetical protein [Myxococcales bacterium]